MRFYFTNPDFLLYIAVGGLIIGAIVWLGEKFK